MAGLSTLLAQCWTTESAPSQHLLPVDKGTEKLLTRLVACACDHVVPAWNSRQIRKICLGRVNKIKYFPRSQASEVEHLLYKCLC